MAVFTGKVDVCFFFGGGAASWVVEENLEVDLPNQGGISGTTWEKHLAESLFSFQGASVLINQTMPNKIPWKPYVMRLDLSRNW